MNRKEPQPVLKLKPRKKPLQKITINRMPKSVYDPLHNRASKFSKKVPIYCRIVLEHAIENKEDYSGPLKKAYPEDICIPTAIHIPIVNKEFMEKLGEWDPYGVDKKNAIAMSILKKHLEVRKW